MPTSTRKVPASALRFRGQVTFGQFSQAAGDDRPRAPAHIVLRTGEPVQHPVWGRCIHDFAGMLSHKDCYALDYQHDPKEVIGHFGGLDTSKGQLDAEAEVFSARPGDRAEEVLQRQAAGTPYEASLSFDPRTALVQDLPEGQTDTVKALGLTL